MGNREAALMAMIVISTMGFLLADGEMRRLKWIQAMRRCLLRMNDAVRYERPDLKGLLLGIDLSLTQQERELTRLMHACAEKMTADMTLGRLFAAESAGMQAYGVLSKEDREAFEQVVGEFGRYGLKEQLRLIDEADERLRRREELLRKESGQRVRLIRTLGLCCGAAVFLVLI